jgi:hypothetical protein
MQEEVKPIAVLSGISKVIAAFAEHGIGKNQKNEQQGFAYRGIDDVLNRMAQHLVAANLIIVPRVLNRDVQERVNSRGNPLFYVTLTVEYQIASTIDGSTVHVVTVGEAMDSGDKATNKALSAAYKYMAFQTFAIPIAEDADKTTHSLAPNKEKTLSPTDIASIRALCKEADFEESKIAGIYGVEALEFVPLSATAEITSNLQKKIKAKSKEKVSA